MSNYKYNYEVGKVYGIVKLLSLYRNDIGRLCATTECTLCHKIKNMRATDLYNEKCISCTCTMKTLNSEYVNTKLYSIYYNIKYRCYNPKSPSYEHYGLRGITICDEWLDPETGFVSFRKWAMSHGYQDGLSIDRIDNDQGYNPDNCQWITVGENTAKANVINVRRKPNANKMYYGIDPDGNYYEFDNANEFARQHPFLKAGVIRKCANGICKTYKQWKFGFVA